MSRILVTGATGFLGRSLVERLLVHGEADLRCLVRPGSDAGALDEIARRFPAASIRRVTGSFGSRATLDEALEGVATVYHLAAALTGAPADIFLGTVVASKNLLEALVAREPRPRVVLVSSFGVYGAASLRRGSVIDEDTPLETAPERRDVYSHAKLRQERLFREYQARHGFPLVVLRPGAIYGPGGIRISSRVGLDLAGVFLLLGGDNPLPLTYVDNCAEAIALAGRSDAAVGETYNVVDDDLVTARQYLSRYRREVKRIPVIPVPYPALLAMSRAVAAYSRWSRGQLPPVFTPYKTATTWKPARFRNAKLKTLGWSPIVSTEEGLRRAFGYFREHPA